MSESTHEIPPPPDGYTRIESGVSKKGYLQYCWTHGWEPCEDIGVPVGGFNALAAPPDTNEEE